MIPTLPPVPAWIIPDSPTESRSDVSLPLHYYRFIGSSASIPTFNAAFITNYAVSTAATELANNNENYTIARMPGGHSRWSYIAYKHPIEFWGSIIALFVASFVIVRTVYSLAPNFAAGFVATALAQSRTDSAAMIVPNWISLQAFVAVLFATVLIWLFGMVTWATTESKISFARDTIKQLIGFFGGWVTGAASKGL
jgi:hypothetical protein